MLKFVPCTRSFSPPRTPRCSWSSSEIKLPSANSEVRSDCWGVGLGIKAFAVLGFRVLGFRMLGFRVSGFRVQGFGV